MLTVQEFNNIKGRLLSYEAPVVTPDGWDSKCTCGSLIPECDKCAIVHQQYDKKQSLFHQTAARDMRVLLDHIEYLEANRNEA